MSKKKIKINFEYFWEGFNPEDNFFTRILRKHYDVEISSNPDYIFFSLYGSKKPPRILKAGKILRKISPNLYIHLRKLVSKVLKKELPVPKNKSAIKIFYSSEHQKPDMSQCDWAFSYAYEDEINHPRYMRIPEYYWFGAGKNLVKGKDYAKKIISQNRKKFCNFIFSNEVKYRNDFFKKLSQYKRVDAPGRCMRNMDPLEKEGHEKLSAEEWTKHKLKFMENYKFTIAIENYLLSGYTDEKIYHAMISGTIPIYYGNPKVSRDFNTNSFINVGDYKNFDEVVKRIKEIDQNDSLYEKILSEPWYKENRPTKYVDLGRIEKRLKEIFGGYESEKN